MPVPPVLIVAPPPFDDPRGPIAPKFTGAAAKSVGLAAAFRERRRRARLRLLRRRQRHAREPRRRHPPRRRPARRARARARGRRATAARLTGASGLPPPILRPDRRRAPRVGAALSGQRDRRHADERRLLRIDLRRAELVREVHAEARHVLRLLRHDLRALVAGSRRAAAGSARSASSRASRCSRRGATPDCGRRRRDRERRVPSLGPASCRRRAALRDRVAGQHHLAQVVARRLERDPSTLDLDALPERGRRACRRRASSAASPCSRGSGRRCGRRRSGADGAASGPSPVGSRRLAGFPTRQRRVAALVRRAARRRAFTNFAAPFARFTA